MRRSTKIGVAFVGWTAGGPVVMQVIGFVAEELLRAPFPCPLCTQSFCVHRALSHSALHVIVAVTLAVFWQRAFDAERGATSPRLGLSAAALASLALALVASLDDLAWAVWISPIVLVLGSLLISPEGKRPARLVGAILLATIVTGHDTVLGLQLTKHDAERPLFRIGLTGLLAAVPVLIIGIVGRNRPDVARPEPTS